MPSPQKQDSQPRQPVSYLFPTSYRSPSMSMSKAQHNYPSPNNQQMNEPYQASPANSNGLISLPSMQLLDPLQQQQQQHMGSHLPHPPVAETGGPNYHNQGQSLPYPSQYPDITSDATGQNIQYALPVTESRVMSAGRHDKVLRTEGVVPLWSELFLLLSCGGFVALVEVSGESCYGVVRLLLGGVDCHAHGLGLHLEGQRGTSTEEESDRGRLDLAS
jgi:hypothetical protein